MLEADRLTSVIFYGPPGTGKTTLASLIAQSGGAEAKVNIFNLQERQITLPVD